MHHAALNRRPTAWNCRAWEGTSPTNGTYRTEPNAWWRQCIVIKQRERGLTPSIKKRRMVLVNAIVPPTTKGKYMHARDVDIDAVSRRLIDATMILWQQFSISSSHNVIFKCINNLAEYIDRGTRSVGITIVRQISVHMMIWSYDRKTK